MEIGVVGPLARRTENGKLIIDPDGVYRKKLAFAESAHRVIAATSRAMQQSTPHIPEFCWRVRDRCAVYVIDLLPQSTRDFMSSYF
jgi:hypothetical protein